ncbi:MULTISPECIES: hypothetical protein [Neobacillus]|uniref:Uncharacterized protein n=1 Tax=Neobacillus rhizophilus TaxID=2833579 RepID=A0A942YWD2_9BACI|nr:MULTISPECIES: hypothetical protein [Neobacillus]MBS4213915.1 hypothetical protein [Neobacillus rhizophilus]MBU8917681.1 hypothetical protein [Bacillus sp. FJAT-29953]
MFFKPINVTIDDFKVNNLDHLSSISFGTTVKVGRNVCAKKTQGYGQQHADYCVRTFNSHYVLDDDVIDQFSAKFNK